MNIVVIDDDQTFRTVLARSLTRLDCVVAHYEHPQDLLADQAHGQDEVLDVILLDMQLQDDTGLKWIQTLRTKFPETQIILLTGYASIATAVEAIKLGADDYLSKPCTARDILTHIQAHPTITEPEQTETVMSVNRLEWEHIQRVLKDHDGNISAAARALGMHRRTLQRKLQKKPARS